MVWGVMCWVPAASWEFSVQPVFALIAPADLLTPLLLLLLLLQGVAAGRPRAGIGKRLGITSYAVFSTFMRDSHTARVTQWTASCCSVIHMTAQVHQSMHT